MAGRYRIDGMVLTACAFLSLAVRASADPAALEHFEKKVRPLLAERCWKCHGPEKAKGDLRLDTQVGVAKGGQSGRVVVPGKPEESLLIKAVQQSGELKMPPKEKLKDQEVAELVRWIRSGANWPAGGATVQVPKDPFRFTPEQKAFWAFQPVKAVTPPAGKQSWGQSPLDRFILAKLEAA
jgi:hypothetical protein